MNGSTGHSTNSEVSVMAKVRTPQGSRMTSYRVVRQATGSFSAIHSRGKRPPLPRGGSRLGSSTRTPSSFLARARSSRPSCRAPVRPAASSGKPTTVTVRKAPVDSTVTT
ncbi:hypothetical protein GCM10020295_33190 [Streptomyces cinereospinus]